MNRGQQSAGETRRGIIKKTAVAAVALSGVHFLQPDFIMRRA